VSRSTGGAETSPAVGERMVRALTECMVVLDDVGQARDAPGIYLVVSESGREYVVDDRLESCTCHDYQYRPGECKHLVRVAYATGAREIPAWVQRDAVDPLLGTAVRGGPRYSEGGGQ